MTDLTAAEIAEHVRTGAATAEAVAQAFLTRAKAVEPTVKAFLHLDEDHTLAAARAVDRKRAAGEPLGRLAGVPVGIKDLLCERGQPTTCGSKVLANFKPPYDAHVIERLRAADAVPLGRLNMDEFAMGSSTENSAFQKTANPWDTTCVPGGSSGGSAAAVAARQVPVSLGTDTGGSIRQPAAYCGVVGLKPTYGRVSRYGLVAFASSLDQIGPFARTAQDAALLLEAIAGHDNRDSTCAAEPVPDYAAECREPLGKLRVGVVPAFLGEGCEPAVADAVRAAVDVFKSLGASVADVELPHAKYGVATYYLIAPAEASSNLARYDGVHFGHRAATPAGLEEMTARSRGEAFGAEVKRRIMLGTFALSSGYRDAYYVKAQQVRRLLADDYAKAFAAVDVIVGPTAPAPAFRFGEKTDDPLAMYLSDIYTVSANMAGVPAVSVPCGFAGGLPLGLQLQGPAFAEGLLLRAATAYQGATDWHTRTPAL